MLIRNMLEDLGDEAIGEQSIPIMNVCDYPLQPLLLAPS